MAISSAMVTRCFVSLSSFSCSLKRMMSTVCIQAVYSQHAFYPPMAQDAPRHNPRHLYRLCLVAKAVGQALSNLESASLQHLADWHAVAKVSTCKPRFSLGQFTTCAVVGINVEPHLKNGICLSNHTSQTPSADACAAV